MLQRLALADNALGRDDESEALAIKEASPRVSYTAADFSELFDEIIRIRICNLVVRLGYIMNFDFLQFCELEKLIDKSDSKPNKKFSKDLRLAAFLYVRATDAWNAVNDELGLRKDFDEEVGATMFAIDLLKSKERVMRTYAFSEAEAKAYMKKQTGDEEIRTMEQEIEAYREHLKVK
jgi:hypothetical protein